MNPISIYIHWPFCLSLCPYCDFNSHISDSINHIAWLNAYRNEIHYFKDKLHKRKIKSIFFGGGTPSLMNPEVVAGIIEAISSIALVDKFTEITLEVNPTSYETKKFQEFKKSGINRVSIGIQSFNEDNLKLLGRKHSVSQAKEAIKSASQLFSRFSFDLIYAIPGQTLSHWQNELIDAIKFAGGHISLYQLTIEKGTPFFKLHQNGNLILPSNEIAADMYEWTNEYLSGNHYNRYEISNYSTQGQECIHNLCYWNYDEYIGIGPGAHSRLHYDNNIIKSVMMIHKPSKWIEKVETMGHGIQNQTILSQNEIIEEILMMGTRLKNGISETKFYQLTGLKFKEILNMNIIEEYEKHKLISIENNMLKLTDKGLILHSYIIPRIFNNII